jgi:hypothetical protein
MLEMAHRNTTGTPLLLVDRVSELDVSDSDGGAQYCSIVIRIVNVIRMGASLLVDLDYVINFNS